MGRLLIEIDPRKSTSSGKPTQFKGQMEGWAFGCDICQDVCPWNRFATPHQEPAFEPHEMLGDMKSQDWNEMTEELFREIFKGSPVKRTKHLGLKRKLVRLAQGGLKTG